MKKIIALFILLGLGFGNTFGQISYTSTDYASAGDSVLVTKAGIDSLGSTNFQTTGTNFNWNFTQLLPLSQFQDKYLSANNTGYKLSYITSCVAGGGGVLACNNDWNALVNLGHLSLDSVLIGSFKFSNVVEHYYKNTNSLPINIIGMSFGLNGLSFPLAIPYTAPDTVYHFPMAYGNSDSVTSKYSINLTGLGINLIYNVQTKRVNHVDGWGSLTTPYKIFPSTIRLNTLLYNYDTLFFNGTAIPIPVTEQNVFSWFETGTKIPVLKVTGTVVNSNIVYSEIEYTDTVRCLTPVAVFTKSPSVVYLNTGTNMVTVSFNNSSVNANTITWNFGDPGSGGLNSSTLSSPSHTYTASGTYKVQLIAGNNLCDPVRYDTIVVPVVVLDSTVAQANFSYSPLQPCAGDTVHFTNTSINSDTYSWNFGDNTTSLLKNPKHRYILYGTFTVTLIAKNNTQSDTLQMPVVVSIPPGAGITPAGTIKICNGDSVIIDAYGGTFFQWSNGKVTESIVVKNAGTYSVKVFNNCGNSISTTDTVIVNQPVQPVITQSNDTLYSTQAVSYQWYLGNMAINNATNRQLVVNQNGMYEVEITDANGCTSTSAPFGVFGTFVNNLTEQGNLYLYPNPTTGNFILEGNSRESMPVNMSIVNLLGETVMQINAENIYSRQIDISTLSAGTYFLKIENKNMSLCKRIVKL